jgi:phenylpyruvate tautomerase PptA (4-oxalocrotonate tautomerase family)
MPIITVKVFEVELTKNRTAETIADITEAVIPYVGEAVRANTWVLVEEVKSGSWASAAMPWDSPISGRSSKTHHRISNPIPDVSVPTTEERSHNQR